MILYLHHYKYGRIVPLHDGFEKRIGLKAIPIAFNKMNWPVTDRMLFLPA